LEGSLKLLQAHLLGTGFVNNCELSVDFRHKIIEHSTDILNFLPGTKASEQATSTLSSCFSVFYDEP
jgi:hypothetical protein